MVILEQSMHSSAWRDCLENSRRGRVGRLLITQSALEGAFLPGFAGSRDDESGLFQSFQTVSGR